MSKEKLRTTTKQPGVYFNQKTGKYDVKYNYTEYDPIDNQKRYKSNEIIKNLNDELDVLKSRKKNIKIAVSVINKSLRYVFFSKARLEIKVENDKYVLYAHGKSVRPNC